MKLSYAIPAASPSYTVLGDEADRSALFELFAPSFQPLNQVEPLAGGTNTFKTPRGNMGVSLQIVVTIPYATQAAALAGIKTLLDAFLVKNHLKIEHGATVHYYPNALLTGYQPNLKGVTIAHGFNFVSDALTTTVPTT